MQALGGRPFASSLLRAYREIYWVMSCSPWGGAWRLGWTPVECGSAHPEGAGSWTVLNEAWVGQVLLDHKVAAAGPSDHPTGHHDSCAALMTSSPLSGSCQGNQVPGVGPQDHPAGSGSFDSSCLVVPATYLPEDPQGLSASSEGAYWAERWALLLPAFVLDQRERGTDCLGQGGGGQSQGRAHCHCTDCKSPAVLKRVQRHLLAVAVAAVVVVLHGMAHCTQSHDVLMEGIRLPQDACNSAHNRLIETIESDYSIGNVLKLLHGFT